MSEIDKVFGIAAALLTFTLAFFGLLARDRKTPTVINSIYSLSIFILTLVLVGGLLGILDQLFVAGFPALSAPQAENSPAATSTSTDKTILSTGSSANSRIWIELNEFLSLQIFGSSLMVLCSAYVLYKVHCEKNRHYYLRTDGIMENSWVGKLYKRILRIEPEYSPIDWNREAELKKAVIECPHLPHEEVEKAFKREQAFKGMSISAVQIVTGLPESSTLITELAKRFLDHGGYVFYASCSRHPVEFACMLRSKYETNTPNVGRVPELHRVFLVDGYTPHFGFKEGIHKLMTKKAAEIVSTIITSAPSYSGLHSAVIKLYKKVKLRKEVSHDQMDSEHKKPALMIYEGCHALIDLESNEQYRIFVRHVLPSERIWGGMMTLFVETSVSSENASVLQESADIFTDKRKKCEENQKREVPAPNVNLHST